MNYYSEYELEQFNNLIYSNNDNEEYEDDSEEDDIKKNEDNNNNSLLDEIKEENNYKKIYFQNNDKENNECNSCSSSEENNNSEKEYNHILIEKYKLEIKKKDYNPKKFPRPKISDLLYKNYDNNNIYLSKPIYSISFIIIYKYRRYE